MSVDRDKKNHRKPLPAVVLTVVLLGVALWFWDAVVKDRLIPKRWAAVEGHSIYRSGQLSAALVKRTLASHGIKIIVALTFDDPQDKDQAAEMKAASELGIELRRFPLDGYGTGDINQYAGAIAALMEAERQGKPVLIHCAAGVQRTGGLIAFYRLLVDRKPPADVLQELRQHGWSPKQNPKLLPYLNENLGRLATILHEKGLLDEIPDPLPTLQAP
jgi:protein tyrosine phosphatase (PTP) superfamily phosphohydrolase (DUF442 family)